MLAHCHAWSLYWPSLTCSRLQVVCHTSLSFLISVLTLSHPFPPSGGMLLLVVVPNLCTDLVSTASLLQSVCCLSFSYLISGLTLSHLFPPSAGMLPLIGLPDRYTDLVPSVPSLRWYVASHCPAWSLYSCSLTCSLPQLVCCLSLSCLISVLT
jgi:hypothetical protein